jgi:hypothetical protein
MTKDHIDPVTLVLYIHDYEHLREDVVVDIEEHLSHCDMCARRLELEIGLQEPNPAAKIEIKALDSHRKKGAARIDKVAGEGLQNC